MSDKVRKIRENPMLAMATQESPSYFDDDIQRVVEHMFTRSAPRREIIRRLQESFCIRNAMEVETRLRQVEKERKAQARHMNSGRARVEKINALERMRERKESLEVVINEWKIAKAKYTDAVAWRDKLIEDQKEAGVGPNDIIKYDGPEVPEYPIREVLACQKIDMDICKIWREIENDEQRHTLDKMRALVEATKRGDTSKGGGIDSAVDARRRQANEIITQAQAVAPATPISDSLRDVLGSAMDEEDPFAGYEIED